MARIISRRVLVGAMDYKTTADIPLPEKLIDSVIGQDRAANIIHNAARQRRNILLIGEPGTGKSMLAQAMAELMPAEELEDVLIYPNPNDENRPLVKAVKTYSKDPKIPPLPPGAPQIGMGRRILAQAKMRSRMPSASSASPAMILFILLFIGLVALSFTNLLPQGDNKWILAASIIGIFMLASAWIFSSQLQRRLGASMETSEPKLVVDNTGLKIAPFIDATGAKAGALLGDVRHDPLQSGGLGTPAHLRVEAGAIHRANKGVLFVDEVSSLGPRSQQELLTAMQERKYSITGQSEMSSGALVKTEPLPCDFVLVAAGNMLDIKNMHPALRSRIRGYGYEIYIESTMPDTPENRDKIVRFVAQEVKKDGKIPHFTREAAEEIIEESKRKAGRKGKLSLRFRELGGLVRAAGDLAREEGAQFVTLALVLKAKTVARTLEQQISAQFIDLKKDYSVFSTTGYAVGKVNGLAVMGDASSGLVMPIVAEVTPASSRSEGKLIATGKLGKIAKEAVENVSAIIKKHIGRDVSEYDIHVQFLQTYEGVEGDSASIAIAVSVISAMEGIPVDQSFVMTGSLNVRGEVLPVGGVTAKVEAAVDSGAATALVPKSNLDDIYLSSDKRGKIKIIPVSDIVEVLKLVLKDSPAKKKLLASMSSMINGEGKHALGNKARKK
ncbi:MAG: ATP-dependent protease LonB [Candidatus Burarchaeum sp.]|nr:ATP-dependent protease LonB [Candidatus Burarchaeum sp.]MDO8339838.1 ATP-dependent protease LonB [Candidatus Burarchaeum sp.]